MLNYFLGFEFEKSSGNREKYGFHTKLYVFFYQLQMKTSYHKSIQNDMQKLN